MRGRRNTAISGKRIREVFPVLFSSDVLFFFAMIPNCRGGRLVSMLCTWRTGVVSGPLWGADGLSLVFSSRFYFPLYIVQNGHSIHSLSLMRRY